MENKLEESFKKLIKYFGSQYKTAKELGVSQSTVNGWVLGKHRCKADIAILVEKKTNKAIKAVELYPELKDLTLS